MERQQELEMLLKKATEAMGHAYAPYSRYAVGAAVLGSSGRVYAGCNVENASYSLTICAERAAIFKAISEGEKDLEALVVITSNGGTPCGACRQVFLEFARPEAPVLVASTGSDGRRIYSIGELLKDGFSPEKLHAK